MNKKIIALLITIALSTVCNGQEIEMKKVFGSYKFALEGEKISMRKIVDLMEPNYKAAALMKKAHKNRLLGGIIGGAGSALVGWNLGIAASKNGNPNWVMAGLGAGLIVVSIPIHTNANKNAKKAVEMYNSSLDASASFNPEFKVLANRNGIGLGIRF